MDWRLFVAKQAVVLSLPFGASLRRLKRRLGGYRAVDRNISDTVRHFEEMEREVESLGRSFRSSSVLELGSGWFPTVPLMLWKAGARRVWLTDVRPNLDQVTFAETIRCLSKFIPDFVQKREAPFSQFPFTYLAPFYAKDVPDGSVDFVLSRTVLEHIPPADLSKLLEVLHRKLAPDGLMLHLVDHSDHLEHIDKGISKINFLTWSKRKHSIVNRLLRSGENRLRHHEYLPIFHAAGYELIRSSVEVHQPTAAAAVSLPLVPPYLPRKYR